MDTINDQNTIIGLSISMEKYCGTVRTYVSLESGWNFVQTKRIASPSVTKPMRSNASVMLATNPAAIAAWRISDCCFPSQRLGWLRTKSTLAPADSSIWFPCRSQMYCFVDRYKYLRVSLKISTTVLFGGRGGMSSSSNSCSATRWDGRRRNLNLSYHLRFQKSDPQQRVGTCYSALQLPRCQDWCPGRFLSQRPWRFHFRHSKPHLVYWSHHFD